MAESGASLFNLALAKANAENARNPLYGLSQGFGQGVQQGIQQRLKEEQERRDAENLRLENQKTIEEFKQARMSRLADTAQKQSGVITELSKAGGVADNTNRPDVRPFNVSRQPQITEELTFDSRGRARVIPKFTDPNKGLVALQAEVVKSGGTRIPRSHEEGLQMLAEQGKVKRDSEKEEKNFDRSMMIGKEFRSSKTFKDFQEINRASKNITAAFARSQDPDVADLLAADQALVVSFNKLLDPGSVVRESEFARTPETQAAFRAIVGKANALLAGGVGLTDDSRKEIKLMADALFEAAHKTVQEDTQVFRNIAEASGADLDIVFGGFGDQFDLVGDEGALGADDISAPDLQPEILEEDIQFTMQQENMTREEVLKALGGL